MFWFDLQWKTQACNWIALLGCQAALNSLELKPSALHYYSPWRVIQTVKVKLFLWAMQFMWGPLSFPTKHSAGFYFSYTRNTHFNISSAFWQVILTWPFISRPKFHTQKSPIVLNDKIGDFFQDFEYFLHDSWTKIFDSGHFAASFPPEKILWPLLSNGQ